MNIKKFRSKNQRRLFHDRTLFRASSNSVRNLPRQSANAEAYLCLYLCICLGKKKNAEGIKFLGILKKYISKNKMYFCLKKKRNVPLNKKANFVFHTIFKLDFITQIVDCIIHRCLYSLFKPFCSLMSVFKKRNIETMLTLPYSRSIRV